MEITRIRHAWPESRGFYMERPEGYGEYTFLHFWNPMNILCDEGVVLSKPDAVIIYDEKMPQKFFSYDTDVVHDWFHVKGDFGSLMKKYDIEANHIYYPSDSRFVSEIIRQMESEFFSGKTFGKEMLDVKLCELIIGLAQSVNCSEGVKLDSNTKRTMNKIRQQAFLTLESGISVGKMAQSANLSESRFYVIYKALFGVSPAKDLILARIQRAKFLLGQNEYSVSEIAKMAGYSSEYHFIRQFKQMTGVTPGKYRG